MSEWRRQAIDGLKPGMVFRFSRTFTKRDVVQFGDITRDYNPVHYDKRFASTKRFQDLICHGLLVGGMICELGGQVGWLATGMAFHFLRPVYIGETITCEIEIREIDGRNSATAEAVFTNSSGVEVLHASLTGYVPGSAEKEVLSKMLAQGDPTNKRR
ncbi:MAG: acyl dehydratase [Proteobacteria bacterium]|nr:acyl dehydratase [Pseudomonadota bacterium]